MVETDGPWPFEGPFRGEETHPHMIHAVIEQIAAAEGEMPCKKRQLFITPKYQTIL